MSTTPPPPGAQAENAHGLAALQAGRHDEALAHFARATALDPDAAPLWRNQATACRALGDDVGERAALDAALDRERTDFATWLRKAQLHQRRGEDADAMAAWSATLQLAEAFPQFPPEIAAMLEAGRAAMQGWQGRVETAVEAGLAPLLAGLDAPSRRRGQAFVDTALRGRRTYRNECSGLYYPFLPADEFFDENHFAWIPSARAAAVDVRAEFLALQQADALPLRPYVQMDKGAPQSKWSTLDGSGAWSAAFLWEYGVANDALLERCPKTAALLEAIDRPRIPGRAPTVFFSILRAGAVIPPHTGVSNTRSIAHLPLVVPDGCRFRVGGETRAWVEGEPFVFDDTIEHEAINPTDRDRAVLIFDVWNPHLGASEREVIARYYASADAAGLNPETRGT